MTVALVRRRRSTRGEASGRGRGRRAGAHPGCADVRRRAAVRSRRGARRARPDRARRGCMLAARSARIERQLDSDRVVEDEPIEATIEVRRGHWGLPGAAVVDPLAGEPVPIHAPMSLISGGRSASVRIVACFPASRHPADRSSRADRVRRARAGPDRPRQPVTPAGDPRAARAPNGSGGCQARGRSGAGRPDSPRSSHSAPPRSTGCGPTAKARRPRGSTGRRWLAGRACSSGACRPIPTAGRWWSSTPANPAHRPSPSISTPRSGPPPRSCSSSAAGPAAACCCPASTDRSRSSRT